MLLYMYLFHVMMSHIYIIFIVQPACYIPANHPDLRYTGAWTSGQLSGDTDSFMWATGLPVTQHIDPSKLETHLALEIDLKLHRYNGSSDKMGALCEFGELSTAMPASPELNKFNKLNSVFSKTNTNMNMHIFPTRSECVIDGALKDTEIIVYAVNIYR